MELAFIVYMISLMDVLNGVAATSVIVCVFSIPVLGMFVAESGYEEFYLKYIKPWIFKYLAFLAVVVLLPNESTANKMLIAYAGQEVIQLEETQQIGSKAYQALNKVLDDYLVEEVTE
jgi:hypothetical protein